MKLFIIHGDHSLNSYEKLQEYLSKAKNKGWETINIDREKENFKNELIGQSLFSEKRLVILNDIRFLTKSNSEWIKDNQDRIRCILIIHHKGIVKKSMLNKLPKPTKIEEFKIPKLIWSFLDSFFPNNSKNCYKLFHEVIKNEAIEFVFAMLARQVRDIYWAKIDPKTLNYPSWRLNKLKKLSSRFSRKELEIIIEEMSQADIKSKTSQADLSKSLDFIIAKYLE